MRKGIIYGIAAYFMWGVFPIYWKLLKGVLPLEILLHRMLWSLVFVVLILAVRKDWAWLEVLRRRPRYALLFLASGALLSFNWFIFIWSVNSGFIVEASLGYFINPLINVAFGVIFLKERLRPGQLIAIFIAALGVAYLTVNYGAFPWIALSLACTFALYGLLRKIAPLESLEGLTVETAFMLAPALVAVYYLNATGQAVFLHGHAIESSLLALAGPVTAIPLLMFSASARRITLIALGLLQYIAPTLQFLVGVLIYHEPFSHVRFIGFCIIWIALAVYTGESLLYARRRILARG